MHLHDGFSSQCCDSGNGSSSGVERTTSIPAEKDSSAIFIISQHPQGLESLGIVQQSANPDSTGSNESANSANIEGSVEASTDGSTIRAPTYHHLLAPGDTAPLYTKLHPADSEPEKSSYPICFDELWAEVRTRIETLAAVGASQESVRPSEDPESLQTFLDEYSIACSFTGKQASHYFNSTAAVSDPIGPVKAGELSAKFDRLSQIMSAAGAEEIRDLLRQVIGQITDSVKPRHFMQAHDGGSFAMVAAQMEGNEPGYDAVFMLSSMIPDQTVTPRSIPVASSSIGSKESFFKSGIPLAKTSFIQGHPEQSLTAMKNLSQNSQFPRFLPSISIGLGVDQALDWVTLAELTRIMPSVYLESDLGAEFLRVVFAKDKTCLWTPDDVFKTWATHALFALSQVSQAVRQTKAGGTQPTTLDQRFFGYLVTNTTVEIWFLDEIQGYMY
ncbi:MAG: hypothetical protein Q9181_006016 [Wetmoreana brouardii]